jgi:hypothetical protein
MIYKSKKSSPEVKKDPVYSEVISFSPKYSIYQFIYILTQIAFLLISLLFITTFYFSEIPEFEAPLITLYYDPANRLDLNNLPIITYSANVVATVRRKNIIPVLISIDVKVINTIILKLLIIN